MSHMPRGMDSNLPYVLLRLFCYFTKTHNVRLCFTLPYVTGKQLARTGAPIAHVNSNESTRSKLDAFEIRSYQVARELSYRARFSAGNRYLQDTCDEHN